MAIPGSSSGAICRGLLSFDTVGQGRGGGVAQVRRAASASSALCARLAGWLNGWLAGGWSYAGSIGKASRMVGVAGGSGVRETRCAPTLSSRVE